MDELSEVGVVSPPKDPELPATRGLVPPPHAQHIRLQAATEAAQDGVLFCHWEEDWRRGGALPYKALPFDPREVSLKAKNERERVRKIHHVALLQQ